MLSIDHESFGVASRWWGNGLDGKPMEIDVVAESTDNKTLLVGEAKWSDNIRTGEISGQLTAKCANIPFLKNRKTIKVLFLKKDPGNVPDTIKVITPADVLNVLR